MTDYWFVPKSYGYGATPVTWQGWAVTLAAVAILVGSTLLMVVLPAASHSGPSFPVVLVWAALQAVVVGALLAITRAKTDGAWRWRWGGKS